MFFADENNSQALGAFLRNIEAIHIDDEERNGRLLIAKDIIGSIYKIPDEWDERCSFNIESIGDTFLSYIRDFDSSAELFNIDRIYVMSYRFLCEYDFLVGAERELTFKFSKLKEEIRTDSENKDIGLRNEIIYASYFMPVEIAKKFINDSNIGSFRSFEDKKAEAEKLKSDWDKELKNKKDDVEKLTRKLDEFKTAFNFVGLYKGFEGLSVQKSTESSRLFWALIFMGILILIPLGVELYLTTDGLLNDKTFGTDHFVTLIPLISIEIILIYFFRVILYNHRSVEAQKIQLELRKTLCQFIQSYAEYSVNIKKQDSAALEKFENLIFSGIISNPEKLPSTFDGLDQVGNLVKRVKNP